MKIGIPEGRFATANIVPARVQGGDSRTAETALRAVDPSVKVKLSDTAAALVSVGERSADFDAEKVARIARAIANGTFKVNSEAAADKMLDNARQQLARPPAGSTS